ncbi:MAG: FGGY-family carbohydrate kinase [Phycisphaerales bacterium]|nr:FGGY-family carbohydrate kinase [Phycisphaerales bacterium]MCB9863172.1 FGGY-family carbohydrate kinase [Phycisphaerales bacterium]
MFMGVDVGTGSARAGVFDSAGRCYGIGVHPIRIWRPAPDYVEQSSDDIWRAVCKAVRIAVKEAGIRGGNVAGISFDATCSLVCLDADDRPVSVSPTGEARQNVIVWMDHRAIEQVNRINATSHKVLRYVGGVMSPEMEPPKLLWLRENMSASWKRTVRFLDLADFLTYRATGADIRSICTAVCKWTYQGHLKPSRDRSTSIGRWDDGFWRTIGLSEFVDDGYRRIGRIVRPIGESIGTGLTRNAARELGLEPGCAVGVGIIDAHAGGLGTIVAGGGNGRRIDGALNMRLSLIGGTSSCHMAVSKSPRYVPGVWGPYFASMLPDLWLTEGGQSATGALIDHCINSHARANDAAREARRAGQSIYDFLNERVDRLAGRSHSSMLTANYHVLADHHGNRSPRANAMARGMVSGLSLNDTIDDLARVYLATIQAVAYGTRLIIETLNRKGYSIDTLCVCGGGSKNAMFLREHADITGCSLLLPKEPEAVLMGAAILGATASGAFGDVLSAARQMTHIGRMIKPARGTIAEYHDQKYRVYKRMYEDQMAYRKIMRSVGK